MNKQKLTLLIVVVLFLCAIAYSFYAMPRQKSVAELKYTTGQKATSPRKTFAVKKTVGDSKKQVSNERVLRLDLLTEQRQGFKGYKRNVFKPVFVDELELMKQKAITRTMPQINKIIPSPQPVIQTQIAKPEAPRAALAQFTFLGYLEKDGKKTLFLTKDKEIILVKNGERFSGGKYEISSLTDKLLTILVVENGEEIVVPLFENRPLVASASKK